MITTTGNLHDIESYFGIDNMTALNARLFLCHWGHLSIIFVWVSSNLFHIGWNGNYKLWAKNPIKTNPIAHGIWDPHFGITISDAYLYNELFLVLFIQSSVNRNIVRFIYHKFILWSQPQVTYMSYHFRYPAYIYYLSSMF